MLIMLNTTISYFELVKLRKERTALNYRLKHKTYTNRKQAQDIAERLVRVHSLIEQNIEESRR